MRNPERIPKVADAFKELWLSCPDMRFGQMFELLKSQYRMMYGGADPFFVEEDKWLAVIEKLKEESRYIHPTSPTQEM